jgi:hypothetical protein
MCCCWFGSAVLLVGFVRRIHIAHTVEAAPRFSLSLLNEKAAAAAVAALFCDGLINQE